MEYYTLGQVIDKMEVDEVAIKVSGGLGECKVENYIFLSTGLYFDREDNNILKSLSNGRIFISKADNEIEKTLFIIMPREVYERISND